MKGDGVPSSRIEAVRRYNRFYTRRIGVLNESLLKSPYSLTEARVLYELAQREETTASTLIEALAINPGYLSRVLRSLRKKGVVERRRFDRDGRQSLLSLSEDGKAAFAELDGSSRAEIAAMLQMLSEPDQCSLLRAMETIEGLLGPKPEEKVPYVLRPPEPGDLGWVVQRHGALYAREYGYDETFEALVAEIAAQFVKNFDARKERCWIAERESENVGSVFLVRRSDSVAKLRLLLVEPKARGLGIGKRLVEECVRFAKKCGYEKITLWTQEDLLTARRIYDQVGFRVVSREPHHSFGHDLVGEIWEKEL